MEFKHIIDQTEIIANCAEKYHNQVTGLFNKLSELNARGPALIDGTIIDFGWSRLVIKAVGDRLVIHEPDFKNNPLKDLAPQVDTTIDVLKAQADVLHHLKLEGTTAYFSQEVIITKGCLEQERIYLERTEPEDDKDSGWLIGEVDDKDEESEPDYEVIYVFELLAKKPELMRVLALPPGYFVVYDGGEIIEVFNTEDENVWY